MKKLYPLFVLLLIGSVGYAQTPSDLEFVPKGYLCPAVNYGYNSWSKYWQGDDLIENGNVGTVSRQQIAVGFNLGIMDRLNFIAMAPYVITHCSQGTLNGQNGLQDIYLNLKGKFAEWQLGPGKLKLVGDLGFSTPIGNYLVDFAPLNLGSGTTNLSYRQMVQYKLNKGFFVEAKANYTYRSDISDIHRDFYYDQGEAYYSDEVYVHDVFDWAAVVGFSNEKFLAEAGYTSYNTLGGSDIRTWDPGFPTNDMDANAVTGRFDYYFSKPKGLQISATGGYTVSGRNMGQSWFANIGVDYLFPLWGKKKSAE